MESRTCALLGLPVEDGAAERGCLMGPDALRTAGLGASLAALGHEVRDLGTLAPPVPCPAAGAGAVRRLGEIAAWTAVIAPAAQAAAEAHDVAIFLGGDHSLSAGTLTGVAAAAAAAGRPQFVLWLDAHPDLHDIASTESGNLHGTPLGYAIGRPGYPGMPCPPATIAPEGVCLMGLRSVDPAEAGAIADLDLDAHDMRRLDETGVARPLRAFLARVATAGGRLHVSLDVDFLDPGIAPAVGTTVPGGATFREAHLVMELLHESGLLTSLDLVELNPFLDHAGRTAVLMRDLAASALGRRILDRPTRRAA